MNEKLPPASFSISEADAALLRTAWEWVLRLRDENVSQDDLTGWLLWYEADERNKEAFEDMQAFWEQADRLVEDPYPLLSELWLAETSPEETGALRTAKLHRSAIPGARRISDVRPRYRRRASLAIGVALAASLCALFLAPKWLPLEPSTTALNSMAAGAANAIASPPAVQETYLPDGSRVELAAKSQVSVEYSDSVRLLKMQGGEAYFTVAHNRERPFIVKIGAIKVRAVGTAFNIRSAGERVVVTVTEGIVEVYPSNAQGTGQDDRQPIGSVRVKAGSEVIWSEKSPGPTISLVDVSHALAWREGRLDYLNEPLATAVADINRYSKRHIVIGDDAVGKIVFSGTVMTNATDAWIQALPDLFPIAVHTNTNGEIVLTRRAAVNEGSSK